jgi:hypothetical protein
MSAGIKFLVICRSRVTGYEPACFFFDFPICFDPQSSISSVRI